MKKPIAAFALLYAVLVAALAFGSGEEISGVAILTIGAEGEVIGAGDLTVRSGTGDADLALRTGNNEEGASGDILIDPGTATTTAGVVTIGGTNAASVGIGRPGQATTVNGTLTVTQVADFDAGMTVAAGQSITGDAALLIDAVGGTLSLDSTGAIETDATTLTADAGFSIDGTGAIALGPVNATSVSIAPSGILTTINGTLAVTQAATFTALADFDQGLTIASGGSVAGDAELSLTAPSGEIRFTTGVTPRFDITAAGHFVAVTDNVLDIGASGATRARTLYVATSVVTAGTLTVSTASVSDTGALLIDAVGGTLSLDSTGAIETDATTFTADAGLAIDGTGALTFGSANATSVGIAVTGITTTVAGPLTASEAATFTALADFDAGLTLASGQSITTTAGNLTLTAVGTVTVSSVGTLDLNTTTGALTTDATTITADAGLAIDGTGALTFGPANATSIAIGAADITITVNGPLLAGRLVEQNIAVAASPNVLTVAESGTVLTNEDATAENHHDLPGAASGLTYTFIVQDVDGMQVNAATGDTIRIAGTVSATGGFVDTATIGDVLVLYAINATEWVATTPVMGWTFD